MAGAVGSGAVGAGGSKNAPAANGTIENVLFVFYFINSDAAEEEEKAASSSDCSSDEDMGFGLFD